MVGLVAGLIPRPLTLLVMLYALARGVAVAGVPFAVAILGGIAVTLAAVAVGAVLARNSALRVMTRYDQTDRVRARRRIGRATYPDRDRRVAALTPN
jgi:ABC-type nickel/cobalt efflux system permease component RcnA